MSDETYALRIREYGRDRMGATRTSFVGEYPLREVESLAHRKARELGGRVSRRGLAVYVDIPASPEDKVRAELLVADELARRRAQEARSQLRDHARREVAAGMSESEAARLYLVDRITIRRWLGKS